MRAYCEGGHCVKSIAIDLSRDESQDKVRNSIGNRLAVFQKCAIIDVSYELM